MLFAMQPSYNELRHAIAVCAHSQSPPLHILNVHHTWSIKGSIVLEQKLDVLHSLIDSHAKGLEIQRLNLVGS